MLMISGSTFSQSTDYEWAKTIGGKLKEDGNAIAIDRFGNIYITGNFNDSVDFDPGVGVHRLIAKSRNKSDVFITKLDASGNFVWAKNIHASIVAGGRGRSMTVDPNGNVYITGSFKGLVDFDPDTSVFELNSRETNAFVLKLDSSGRFVWAGKLGDVDYLTTPYSIALDASGNVHTIGYFQSLGDFDPGESVFTMYASDRGNLAVYISKLDSLGNFIWAKSFKGLATGVNIGKGIAIDTFGNIYSLGFFGGSTDFDPGPGLATRTSGPNGSLFISKLNPEGEFIWAIKLDDSQRAFDVNPVLIAINPKGGLYIAGCYSDTIDFDPGSGLFKMGTTGFGQTFILKLNDLGNFVWAKNFGSQFDFDAPMDIVSDLQGNVFTTGYFIGFADFDPGPETYTFQTYGGIGESSTYTSKLDANGNFIWARSVYAATDNRSYSIAFSSFGEVYVTGYFWGKLDLKPQPGASTIESKGERDIFIFKIKEVYTGNEDIGAPENLFSVYPNPTQDNIKLSLSQPTAGGTIIIKNCIGQVIEVYSLVDNGMKIVLPESVGVYFVEVQTAEGKRMVKKLIKY
jgi:hypothetical protein